MFRPHVMLTNLEVEVLIEAIDAFKREVHPEKEREKFEVLCAVDFTLRTERFRREREEQ
jgi:hypothetical protein